MGATEDILKNGGIEQEIGAVVHLIDKMMVEEDGHHTQCKGDVLACVLRAVLIIEARLVAKWA